MEDPVQPVVQVEPQPAESMSDHEPGASEQPSTISPAPMRAKDCVISSASTHSNDEDGDAEHDDGGNDDDDDDDDVPSRKRLYVSNLKWQISEDRLRNEFEKFGLVTEARVVRDRRSGWSRGFGFVSFDSIDAATAAIDGLNGVDIEGRMVRIELAKSTGPLPRRNSSSSHSSSGCSSSMLDGMNHCSSSSMSSRRNNMNNPRCSANNGGSGAPSGISLRRRSLRGGGGAAGSLSAQHSAIMDPSGPGSSMQHSMPAVYGIPAHHSLHHHHHHQQYPAPGFAYLPAGPAHAAAFVTQMGEPVPFQVMSPCYAPPMGWTNFDAAYMQQMASWGMDRSDMLYANMAQHHGQQPFDNGISGEDTLCRQRADIAEEFGEGGGGRRGGGGGVRHQQHHAAAAHDDVADESTAVDNLEQVETDGTNVSISCSAADEGAGAAAVDDEEHSTDEEPPQPEQGQSAKTDQVAEKKKPAPAAHDEHEEVQVVETTIIAAAIAADTNDDDEAADGCASADVAASSSSELPAKNQQQSSGASRSSSSSPGC